MIHLQESLAHLREKEVHLILDIADTLTRIDENNQEDRQKLLQIAQDLRDMFFIVAIIGEFNAGKSSFVNALLGESLLPTGVTPTTEYIELVRYAKEADRKAEVKEQDALRVWYHPGINIEGVAIVDTPGTGSVFQKHETLAKSFLHRSDLVIFVTSAKHAFAETDRLYLQLAKDYGKKIVMVVNQIDLLSPSEQQDVRRFIEHQVKDKLDLSPLIFMVSAKRALEGAADSGMEAFMAHLQASYRDSLPAKQKLLAQLTTVSQLLSKYQVEVDAKEQLLSNDRAKAKGIQTEIQSQAMDMDGQMREAMSHIQLVMEGIRKRGIDYIDHHMSIRRIGRGVDRNRIQAEFQEQVIGSAVTDMENASTRYINAVVDQSRVYWRNMISRLQALQDLLEQEVKTLDADVYAEQRQNLQDAIQVAETELRSYSSGKVIGEMSQTFNTNLQSFQGTALATLSGLAAIVVAVATPGPLIGLAAAPLALPVFIAGAVVAGVFSVPAMRYYRRMTVETKQAFNDRVDEISQTYTKSLENLTRQEKVRLQDYSNQMLRPIFSRLDSLAEHYKELSDQMANFDIRIEGLQKELKADENK